MRAAALAMAALLLGACQTALRWDESAPASGVYTVRQGDSLYAIALRYDLSPDDLARWNDLGNGDLIFPGQRLRLTEPEPESSSVSKRDRSASSSGM